MNGPKACAPLRAASAKAVTVAIRVGTNLVSTPNDVTAINPVAIPANTRNIQDRAM